MLSINILSKLIKRSRRWFKKTESPFFLHLSEKLENKKKERIFSVLSRLDIKVDRSSPIVTSHSRTIWICWFQGLESAPELVKRCIASIQRNTHNAEVVILTDNNISDYITLPEYIIRKYQEGFISKAQYSDIIRCSLLYKFGGIWMDATVFTTKMIPESLFDCAFSSLRFTDENGSSLSGGVWTAYLLASHKNSPVVKLVRDLLFAYWQHYDKLIEYFLIDYCFLFAYEKYNTFHEIMDNQPVIGNNRFLIRQIINSVADDYTFNILKNDPIGIYKLSHKETYKTIDNEQPTIYSKIIDGTFSFSFEKP